MSDIRETLEKAFQREISGTTPIHKRWRQTRLAQDLAMIAMRELRNMGLIPPGTPTEKSIDSAVLYEVLSEAIPYTIETSEPDGQPRYGHVTNREALNIVNALVKAVQKAIKEGRL